MTLYLSKNIVSVMTAYPKLLWVLLLACLSPLAHARVVINEVMYHAPDDLDDLQYVELHNAGDQPVDLGGWAIKKGVKFKFPSGTRIEPRGFLATDLASRKELWHRRLTSSFLIIEFIDCSECKFTEFLTSHEIGSPC